MPRLRYLEQDYESRDGETVLDCLSRQGVSVPSSCRSGVCQSCLMRSLDAAPPAEAQRGLRPTLQQQKHFLPAYANRKRT